MNYVRQITGVAYFSMKGETLSANLIIPDDKMQYRSIIFYQKLRYLCTKTPFAVEIAIFYAFQHLRCGIYFDFTSLKHRQSAEMLHDLGSRQFALPAEHSGEIVGYGMHSGMVEHAVQIGIAFVEHTPYLVRFERT